MEAAVSHLPDAFRLWMERYQIALELHEDERGPWQSGAGLATLPAGAEGESLRAGMAAPPGGIRLLVGGSTRPRRRSCWQSCRPKRQGDHHPPILLQVEVALRASTRPPTGRWPPCSGTRPVTPDLLLLQADCLAGHGGLGGAAALPGRPGRGLPRARRRSGTCGAWPGPTWGNTCRRAWTWSARRAWTRANLRYLLDAGHACAELGDWDRAESHWRQALQVDPQAEEALIHLAEARRELEDLDGARRYLRECLLHHPDSVDAQTRLAELEAN